MGSKEKAGPASGRTNLCPERLGLRVYPDPILRQEASPIILFNRELDDLLEIMLLVMKNHRGIGLAAHQIGIARRIVVADIGQGPLKLVNPEIVTQAGDETMPEGCLSLPGSFAQIRRNTCIEVHARDSRGKPFRFEAVGLLARVLQHEIDHLNGKLICDYNPPDHGGDQR